MNSLNRNGPLYRFYRLWTAGVYCPACIFYRGMMLGLIPGFVFAFALAIALWPR